MSSSLLQRVALLLTLALAGGASNALTVPELQNLLRSTPQKPIVFSEVRESPWLAMPAESRGTLHSTDGVLEKRVEAPRPEIWRMFSDRIEYVGANTAEAKQILFRQSPAVGVLADALRNGVAGDLQALERSFRIALSGDRRAWKIRLNPTAPDAMRYLDYLELEGANAQLLVITVLDRQGERTTTRLFP